MRCIDFHTHAFPDALAERTIPALAAKGSVTPALDGKVSSLVASMDRAGIERSVVCSIATQPRQFEAILAWSAAIRSSRLVPFPSVHPADPDCLERLSRIRAEGFAGVKMHPYYQEFTLDEGRMFPVYERIAREGLILVMHTGYDIGYPRDPIATPQRVVNVVDRVPELRLVATHMGAWDDWQEVLRLLSGRPVYMDCAFSLEFLVADDARQLFTRHPQEYLLFGSDSPWADQGQEIAKLKRLGLDEELERLILSGNAERLLADAS